MKNILNIILCLTLVTSLTSCLAFKRAVEAINEPSNAGFVPNLPDVPMPQNFVADSDTSSFFDSAEGRIAEINASGFQEVAEVYEFYEDIMPQFGWQKMDRGVYKKNGEMLVITAEKGRKLTNLKFQLRPTVD
jgi:hypothetical protein